MQNVTSYCNPDHQRADWKRHNRAECKPIQAGLAEGKKVAQILVELFSSKAALNPSRTLINYSPDLQPLPSASKHLRLERCWPIFAAALASARMRRYFPQGHWMDEYVEAAFKRPDGADVVKFAKATEQNTLSKGYKCWWPSAPREKDINRLFRRLTNLCFSLEAALAISLSVRATLYQNDYAFTYYNKPIADFGVCAGSLLIHPVDILWAINSGETEAKPMHHPFDHYWLYFTTTDGETAYFDFSLHQYKFHLCPGVKNYVPKDLGDVLAEAVPGYTYGRAALVMGPRQAHLHFERATKSRYSIAQTPLFEQALKGMTEPLGSVPGKGSSRQTLIEICHKIRDGNCQDHASDDLSYLATLLFYREISELLGDALRTGSYKKFPTTIPYATIDED